MAFARANSGGVSPWRTADTDQIIRRLAERWSEATLSRSRLVVLEETAIRDVLVAFNNKTDVRADARFIPFAGGQLRYIEVYAPSALFGVDVEYAAGSLLHELGHALGCCSGPGTSGGHFVGPNCQRILCSPHGTARTFSDEELRQMGLGGWRSSRRAERANVRATRIVPRLRQSSTNYARARNRARMTKGGRRRTP